MIRTLIIISIWIITFCMFDIRAVFKDGLKVELHGWGNWLLKKLK